MESKKWSADPTTPPKYHTHSFLTRFSNKEIWFSVRYPNEIRCRSWTSKYKSNSLSLKIPNLVASMGLSPWLSYSQPNAKSWCKWNILTKFMAGFAFKGSNKCAQHSSGLSLPAKIHLTQWDKFGTSRKTFSGTKQKYCSGFWQM